MKPALLVVDDDIQVVKQLKWALHDHYEVLHAVQEPEILDGILRHRPKVALVDMHMPPSLESPDAGLGIIRLLRRTHPDITVIGISVDPDESLPQRVTEAGAERFIRKPFDDADIRRILAFYEAR